MTYPNIELLANLATRVFVSDHDVDKRFIPDMDIYVFPQVWPNTGGGFAVKGYLYGQAFTKQYTTVLINRYEDAAVVCFDNQLAYEVRPIPPVFYERLAKHDMASVDQTEVYDNQYVRGLRNF